MIGCFFIPSLKEVLFFLESFDIYFIMLSYINMEIIIDPLNSVNSNAEPLLRLSDVTVDVVELLVTNFAFAGTLIS